MAIRKVTIIDYGLGNVYSIQQACQYVGANSVLCISAKDVKDADALILPGVGAFGDAMKDLNDLGLRQAVIDFAKTGKPIMGVCLGMQLLFDQSEEFGLHEGLGLIKGKVMRFPPKYHDTILRVPHIGWNKIFGAEKSWAHTPLNDLPNGEYMYFVHSYFALPAKKEDILSTTVYSNFEYCSAVSHDNVFGFQFHPEKSGKQGLSIYKNFISL